MRVMAACYQSSSVKVNGATHYAYSHSDTAYCLLISKKVKKVKVVSLYSAVVTNQSRLPHGHRVQPADTGWRSSRLGNPSQLYQGPHLL